MITNTFHHKVQKLADLCILRQEATLLNDVFLRVKCEKAMHALSEASGIDDPELLARLLEAGFDAELLPALDLVPFAFVAWASGSVTAEEREFARAAVQGPSELEHGVVLDRFESWLRTAPSAKLFTLWKDCTSFKNQHRTQAEREAAGEETLALATKIAAASGGILGFGKICEAEQVVLNAIKEVYGIG
jgi:hypothetical protein